MEGDAARVRAKAIGLSAVMDTTKKVMPKIVNPMAIPKWDSIASNYFSVTNFDDLSSIALALAYSGLDLTYTYNLLNALVKDPATYQRYLQTILIWNALRGSTTNKIEKTHSISETEMEAACKAWKIELKRRTKGVTLGKDEITISRIAAVYPVQAAQAFIVSAKAPVGYDPTKGLLPGDVIFPYYLASSTGASLMPNKEMFTAWYVQAVQFDIVINQPSDEFPKRAPNAMEVLKYGRLAYESNVIPKAERAAAISFLADYEESIRKAKAKTGKGSEVDLNVNPTPGLSEAQKILASMT